MKLLSPLALFTVCGLLAAPLMAAEQAPELTGCAAKKHEISQQLEQARAHGNSNQVAGLEKALSEVEAHCTDAGDWQYRQNHQFNCRANQLAGPQCGH